MKVFIKTFILVTFFLLLFSCASSKRTAKPVSEKPEPTAYDESFDPLSLNDEDIKFPEEKAVEPGERAAEQPGKITEAEEQASVENRLVDGYRVQLFATKDIESATIAKKEAEFAFSEDSVNVYIEFDSPYYKLRIGDCKTREEAERLREIARNKGYPSAWIVRSKVWTNPPLPKLKPVEMQDRKEGES